MSSPIPRTGLAGEIRALYRTSPAQARAAIEEHLETKCKGLADAARLTLLDQVTEAIAQDRAAQHDFTAQDEEVFSRLFSLVLGDRVAKADLPAAELGRRLAESLNTIFDSLNELMRVIYATLSEKETELETIRTVIGLNLDGDSDFTSLKDYLDQIKKAFLIAHQAFREAAHLKVGEMLAELDPERLAAMAGSGGLGFGPFRKAESFEIYQEQYKKCKAWFEAEHFMDDLLREFERRCQKLLK